MNLQERLLARFLRYAAVTTQSVPESETIPSSEGQWTLAHMLMEDIAALGVQDIGIDEHAVVVGRLPARLPAGHAPVPVVVLTHRSRTADLEAALDEIRASGVASEAPVRLRML